MTSDKQISMSSTKIIYVSTPHYNIHILINQHATFFYIDAHVRTHFTHLDDYIIES